MARTALRPGPGIITLGTGPLSIQEQLLSFRITWAESTQTQGEVRNFMDGTTDDDVDETASYRASATGTVQQDNLATSGLIAYTWDNAGEEVAFTFQPESAIAREITGTVRIVPLDVGGDAKTKNTSDFTWVCTVDPALGNVV